MCGIAGLVALGGELSRGAQRIAAMIETLRERGPDGQGVFVDRDVALGHRRLSVIDPSEAGHQPMVSDDGRLVIVHNGEVYNFQELRAGLERRGHRFRSRTDTEVVLRLFEEKGAACVEDLVGMFAFAVWDRRAHALFLARDRLGKKPLVFTEHGGCFYFASEIGALLQNPELPRDLAPEAALAYMLHLHVPYPLTIYRGIEKVPPGTALELRDGRLARRRYWTPDFGAKTALTEAECATRVADLLGDAVRSRMVADVPVGAFLSGGMDSSAVVALMSAAASGPVRTFSVGFSAPGLPDPEFDFSRRVAVAFGTDHTEVVVDEGLAGELPALVRRMDEPFGNPVLLPHFVLARAMRKDVTVALTGDGGDEVFGGYPAYTFQRLVTALLRVNRYVPFGVLGGSLEAAGKALGLGALRREGERIARLGSAHGVLRAEGMARAAAFCRASVFAPAAAPRTEGYDVAAVYARLYRECRAGSHLDGVLYADLLYDHQHGVTVLGDLSGMANSLEIRCPFLDHRLVEFAASLPLALKVPSLFRTRANKYVLRRALAGVLPPWILARKKVGFGEAIPYPRWLRGPWRPWVERVLFDGHLEGLGLFSMAFVRSAWRQFLDPRGAPRLAIGTPWLWLWQLMIFDLWFRVHVEGQDVDQLLGGADPVRGRPVALAS